MYMRVLAITSLLSVSSLLVRGEKKSCGRIQINNEKVYGECCIFKKHPGDEDLSEMLQEALIKKHQGLDPEHEGRLSLIPTPNEHRHPSGDHHLHVHGMMGPWQQMGHGIGLEPKNDNFPAISPSSQEDENKPSDKSITTTSDLPTAISSESLPEESSSEVLFPTDQTPTQNGTFESDNAADTDAENFAAKTTLGNRNAIDAPLNGCPKGQARDPRGDCLPAF